MPFTIDRLDKVKVKRVFKEEFGFRTLQAGGPTSYSGQSYSDESIMLTGDLNVLDVSWIVQYRIKDAKAFLFSIRDPRVTVRDLSEAVMRQVIGDYSVSEALTASKNEISQAAKVELQEALDLYNSGIQVSELELQEVLPPEEVAPYFNDVNAAEQEREKSIYQALKEQEKVIEEAKGEAEKTVSRAQGYAQERINRAQGDASKFLETYQAYKDAKDVTRRRLYLEALQESIPNAGKVYIFDPKAKNIFPLLNLDRK